MCNYIISLRFVICFLGVAGSGGKDILCVVGSMASVCGVGGLWGEMSVLESCADNVFEFRFKQIGYSYNRISRT